jgi:hypothetical protein
VEAGAAHEASAADSTKAADEMIRLRKAFMQFEQGFLSDIIK